MSKVHMMMEYHKKLTSVPNEIHEPKLRPPR